MSRDYGRALMTIRSFDECSYDIKPQLRESFASWAKVWDESTEVMTDDKLEDAVDQFVFDNWDSTLPPVAPKFERPKFHTNTIRIGKFSKDLPDPKKARSMFDDEPWDELLLTLLGKAPPYKVPRVRKAGQPALLGACLDKIKQSIVFDYVDSEGKYAPATYIDFMTGPDNQPNDELVVKALFYADGALCNAYDQWNRDLCVYLCRRLLFNYCHSKPWDPFLELEKRYWDKSHFLRAPSIGSQLGNIKERIAKYERMYPDKKVRGPLGSRCFNVRSEPEPESEIKSEIKSEVKPETKSKIKSEVKSESNLEDESEPEVQYMRTVKRKFEAYIVE
ncbi:hypothetical protein BJ166DRAFT_610424 [Pestalotiopsis sp. NC0098]|nr:hypothetical protein BJ166DRAFT_610424 [Pestalotiopsis sp. NC0098]